MNSSETFSTYLGKYLGLALVAGAVVHFGTIGGGYLRYIVTALSGLSMMVVANVTEGRRSGVKMNARFFAAVTILSVATGFLSGGIQHYIDNPSYAGWLLVVGLTIAFSSYHNVKRSRPSAPAQLVIYMVVVLLVVVTITLPDTETAAPSHHSPVKSLEAQQGHH
jgi:peptidoglycan/LPS O-acetylase OafA/YrhL